MGAWDTGNFSNDTALDFVDETKSLSDLNSRISAVLEGSAYLDTDLAAEALAAADLLAAKLGRPAPDFPEDLSLDALDLPGEDALSNARQAALRISNASELAELWAESDAHAEWQNVITDLVERLDPNTAYTPKPKPEQEGGIACYFCRQLMRDGEHLEIEFFDDAFPGISSSIFTHKECLEHLFEPPYYDEHGKPLSDLTKRVEAFLESRDMTFAILDGPPYSSDE
ncbi:MAG: DUF4259 domain-containing protein [Pseudomonadota bacterium]